jgi:heat shock protein HslJ
MNRKLTLLLPLALMAACSQTPAPAPAGTGGDDVAPAAAKAADQQTLAHLDAQRLQSQHWLLQQATGADGKRIDALFAREDKPVTLDFADGRLSVNNACNHMGGSYTLADGKLTVGAMASTMMACTDKALMALDEAVSSRLQGELKATQDADGKLTLTTAKGDVLVFNPEPTAETRYGGAGETVFLEVAARTQKCSHPLIPDYQCLHPRGRRAQRGAREALRSEEPAGRCAVAGVRAGHGGRVGHREVM